MIGLKRAMVDKHGPKWFSKDVHDYVVSEINLDGGSYFTRGAKQLNKDYEKAVEILNAQENLLQNSLENLKKLTNEIQDGVKIVSADVRKSTNELANGLLRIEKQANFANLERYVSLLERAASAMQSLSDLEKQGKLEKIVGALK